MKSILALFLSASCAGAAVRLPAVISDHMVLQSGKPVAIWGLADIGEEVRVTFGGQQKTAKAGSNGKWQVSLDPLKANEQSQKLMVSGSNSIEVNDVLVGEAWLASGQSNMAFKVERGKDAEQEIAGAKFPQIRMFTVTRGAQGGGDCTGQWSVCSPESVPVFSAVAYFFGRELHQKLKVPVGLINASVGGTDIAAWTSMEVQEKVPELQPFLEEWRNKDATYDAAKDKAVYQKRLANWKINAEKAKAAGKPEPRRLSPPKQPRLSSNYPAYLFNGYIAPVIPYTITGAIWYQGEHNCADIPRGILYQKQMPLLVNDWRTRWGADFPFAWVQLPGYLKTGPGRAYVRDAQLKALSLKNTGMAVTLDVGDANDNHPKNKQDVALRLAQWALGDVYQQKVQATSGPLPAGHQIKGGEVVMSFSHTEGGLKAKGELKGFVIAGEDKVWKPAQARIEGETVVISSPDVPKPAAARYAWDVSPEASLYNGAGLPASPFRTDDWTN